MISKERLMSQLDNCLLEAEYEQWKAFYSHGKVRDFYRMPGKRILITTDRQSAFDRILGAIPLKGQVLNHISCWWFEKTRDIVKNHLLEVPDPNVSVVREVRIFPVEIVVRGYITGTTDTSAWVNYEQGVREFCGVHLPEGLRKNQQFEAPIITPTTKAESGHDEKISPNEIIEGGLVPEETWHKIEQIALDLFERGTEVSARNGLILVDTKYEMGETEDGEIVVADEVHTPDSSRFWIKDTYKTRFARDQEPESLDKEFLRLWLKEKGISETYLPDLDDEIRVEVAQRYIDLFERVTGETFTVENLDTPVKERIEGNIAKYFSSGP